MIFVTIGTTKIPFQRLLDEVACLIDDKDIKDKFVVQFGVGKFPKLKNVLSQEYFSFTKTQDFLQKADVIICHAGLATIIQSLKFGKIPIVVPRQKKFAEHVNNHEIEIAKYLAKKKLIYCVIDIIDLKDTILRTKTSRVVVKKYLINPIKLVTNLQNWTKNSPT